MRETTATSMRRWAAIVTADGNALPWLPALTASSRREACGPEPSGDANGTMACPSKSSAAATMTVIRMARSPPKARLIIPGWAISPPWKPHNVTRSCLGIWAISVRSPLVVLDVSLLANSELRFDTLWTVLRTLPVSCRGRDSGGRHEKRRGASSPGHGCDRIPKGFPCSWP